MKRFLRAAACAALLTTATTAAFAQAAGGIFPYPYERFELDNGLRVYLVEAGAPGQLAYVTMVRTGSREEVEAGKSGFAHFFEHMMFRGTEKYPNYDGITETMGAARNASTSDDWTRYYLVASSEYLEQIVDLEADRFQNLKYDEPAFRTEAGAILGEYGNSASGAFNVLDRNLRDLVWTQHTYRHSTIGLEADVRAMPEGFEYSRSFYDRFYRPENCVLLVVGDFDLEVAERLIREHYGPWKPGYQQPEVPVEPPQGGERVKVVDYPGRTLPIVTINYRAPAWSATDEMAVATELIGPVAFGQNSEIYRKLVIDERRVQFLQAGFGLQRDPTIVSIAAMVSNPADVDAVRAELLQAVEKVRNEPVDAKLLADTKSNQKYGFLMGLETALGVAFSLTTPVISTGGIEAVDDYYRSLDGITAEDIQKAAQQILVESGRSLVTLVQAGGAS
jgi:zinc protease